MHYFLMKCTWHMREMVWVARCGLQCVCSTPMSHFKNIGIYFFNQQLLLTTYSSVLWR